MLFAISIRYFLRFQSDIFKVSNPTLFVFSIRYFPYLINFYILNYSHLENINPYKNTAIYGSITLYFYIKTHICITLKFSLFI